MIYWVWLSLFTSYQKERFHICVKCEYGIYYHAANLYGDLNPYKNNIKLYEWIECTISDRCVVKLFRKCKDRAIPA